MIEDINTLLKGLIDGTYELNYVKMLLDQHLESQFDRQFRLDQAANAALAGFMADPNIDTHRIEEQCYRIAEAMLEASGRP